MNNTFTFRIIALWVAILFLFSAILGASAFFLYSITNSILNGQSNPEPYSTSTALISARDTALGYFNTGLDYYDAKDYVNAELYYRKAIEADPSYALPYSNLGIILSDTNRHEEARKNYDKAIELDPTYPKPYNNIGYDYFLSKDYANAEIYYNKSIQADPDYYLPYSNLGDLYLYQKSNKKKAIEYYNKAAATKSIPTHELSLLRGFIAQLESLPY